MPREDHDQRMKVLLREFFAWFFELILPGWPERFDLSRNEWLPQEVFTDPPQGDRLILDLVVRLWRKEPKPGENPDLIANVEIESEDSATRVRRQSYEHYKGLRKQYNVEVLPLVLYLQVALEGRGTDTYTEETEELTTLTFQFYYLGLRGLKAQEYIEGDNLLGVAFTGMMRHDKQDGPRLKARAMQRIATADLTTERQFLLLECIEAYSPLAEPHLAEFQRLLHTEEFRMALQTAKTSFEQGEEKGLEKGLEKGEVIGRILLCQELLHQSPTPQTELRRLSLEELNRMVESLRQQLASTNGVS